MKPGEAASLHCQSCRFPPLQPTTVSMGIGHVSFGIATVFEVSDEELCPAFGDAVQNDDGDWSGL